MRTKEVRMTVAEVSIVDEMIREWERGRIKTTAELGRRVRVVRKRLRITLVELARRAEITNPTLVNFERGKRDAMVSVIQKVFEALRAIEKERHATKAAS
jgi:predicted transcriptional regulator